MLKTFAEDLKRFRLEKDITLEEIASQTRLRIAIFQSMEQGDFSFQPPTYIRAFIKQFATALDLDPDEVLKDYDKARAGNYKSKFPEEKKSETPSEKTPPAEKEIIEVQDEHDVVDHKTSESEKPFEHVESQISKESIKLPKPLPGREVKPEKIRKSENVELTDPDSLTDNTFISGSMLKKTFFYLFAAAFLVGVFFMFRALFFTGGSSETEIIRQSDFNDVVRETERKLLGIKTEEEIQDSIRKAQEELMKQVARDSLHLEVVAKGTGRIFVSSDSANVANPPSFYYEAGDTGTYAAKNFFYFGVNDPATIEIFLNDRKLDLPQQRRIRNLLIDSSGVKGIQSN